MATARERVRQLSRRMELLIAGVIGIVAVVALYVVWLGVTDPGQVVALASQQFEMPSTPAPSGSVLLLLGAVMLSQTGLLVLALLSLKRAFGEIARHDIASGAGARWMRLSGLAFMANAVAMGLARPLLSLILSIGMPAGQRFVSIGIGTPELQALMVSGVLLVFGHLMAVAAEVDDDNRRFV